MSFFRNLAGFNRDHRGNVAMLTALTFLPLVGGIGLAIDYSRAVGTRGNLDRAATAAANTAIAAGRALLVANPRMTNQELTAAASARAIEVFSGQAPDGVKHLYEITGMSVTRVGSTLSAKVTYSADVPNVMMSIFGYRTARIGGSYAATGPLAPDANDPDYILREKFDKFEGSNAGKSRWSVHQSYENWQTTNGLEIGTSDIYGPTPPPGGDRWIAELDGHKNGTISRKLLLQRGDYEVRYYFHDRLPTVNYDPVWICGSKSSEVSWATDIGNGHGYQSNRIGVYLQPADSDQAPETYDAVRHNLIDVCVTSGRKWIERSIKITVNTSGYFWLAFQGEGMSDTRGGLLSDIRVCKSTCPGKPLENYPWTAGTKLFSDSFESLTGSGVWTERTLDKSGTNYAWPRLPSGWTTWPENQVDFFNRPSATRDGSTYLIELGASGRANPDGTVNRGISRKFVLPPGFYKLSYYYRGNRSLTVRDLCGIKDLSAQLIEAKAMNTTTTESSTNLIKVAVDADRLVSHPRTAPILRAPASWFDPDDVSAPTLPRLPRNFVDACVWTNDTVLRSITFEIKKPGLYWLTFIADGLDDYHSGFIDTVTLTAAGGVQSARPNGVFVVPTAGPHVGSPIVLGAIEIALQ